MSCDNYETEEGLAGRNMVLKLIVICAIAAAAVVSVALYAAPPPYDGDVGGAVAGNGSDPVGAPGETGPVTGELLLPPPTPPPAPATDPAAPGSDTDRADAVHGAVVEITTREQLTELVEEVMFAAMPGIKHPRIMMAEPMLGSIEPQVMVDDMDVAFSDATESSGGVAAGAPPRDYSGTNVQVTGVDEPDYLKNDGDYAYVGVGNTIAIVDVWPASEINIVTKVALDIDPYEIHDILLSGDDLVVIHASRSDDTVIREFGFVPEASHKPVTNAIVIDIADRDDPAIRERYSVGGWFEDARMIGDHVYIITKQALDYDYPEFPIILDSDDDVIMPRAFHFGGDQYLSYFTTISAIDLSGNTITPETFLMGNTGTYYMTHSNLYLTYRQSAPPGFDPAEFARERFFTVVLPLFPDDVQEAILDAYAGAGDPAGTSWWRDVSEIMQNYYNLLGTAERDELFERIGDALAAYDSEKKREHSRTIIHKVSINGSDMEFRARGSVPGMLLNPFSLGESGGGERLRVATTLEYYTEFAGFSRSNGVYALDADLEPVGSIEDVAPDERIYSARFMGDRLYMVTFQQVDPFFVIDISGDKPRILGELKIPGFSNYLHPFDGDHVIGIGRDTKLVNDGFGEWVRQLGLKIALFDVSDVSNPAVADQIIIGEDSSVTSDALYDHHAFFLDGKHKIMSIPVDGPYEELDHIDAMSKRDDTYGGGYWSGFYVLDVDPTDGIDVRGHVSHSALATDDYADSILRPRTFYIEDVLYTVSGGSMIASDIGSLERLGFVKLTGTGSLIDYLD